MKFNIFLVLIFLFVSLFIVFNISKQKNIEKFKIRTYGSSNSELDLTDKTTLIIFSTFMGISGLLLIVGIGFAIYLSYSSSDTSY